MKLNKSGKKFSSLSAWKRKAKERGFKIVNKKNEYVAYDDKNVKKGTFVVKSKSGNLKEHAELNRILGLAGIQSINVSKSNIEEQCNSCEQELKEQQEKVFVFKIAFSNTDRESYVIFANSEEEAKQILDNKIDYHFQVLGVQEAKVLR